MPLEEAGEAATEALIRQERAESRRPRILAGEKLGDVSGASRMVLAEIEDQK
jgi:4-hydroxy-4-methyl-2-oxoglutarate aldolase